MKICIVCINSPEYEPLARITLENKTQYCMAWQGHADYQLFHHHVQNTDAKKAGYDRLEVLARLMNRHSANWFWCQGVDTMIMNFTTPMAQFVDNAFHLIIARDCYSLNGDSVLIRNSREGRNIIARMLSERDWYENMANAPYADCSAYDDLSRDQKWKDKIKVVPQKGFNSADYTQYGQAELLGHPGQYSEGDFLLHWGGLPLGRRIELAKEYSTKVIR